MLLQTSCFLFFSALSISNAAPTSGTSSTTVLSSDQTKVTDPNVSKVHQREAVEADVYSQGKYSLDTIKPFIMRDEVSVSENAGIANDAATSSSKADPIGDVLFWKRVVLDRS